MNKKITPLALNNSFTYRGMITTNNAKTSKGEKIGFLTGILYMLPVVEVCPFSKVGGCIDLCLVKAGRGNMPSVKTARAERTDIFLNDKNSFFNSLILDIQILIIDAKKQGLTPCIRLNGTSDINYLKYPFFYDGIYYGSIFEYFNRVQFYDYSKDPRRSKGENDNYHLTYSIHHSKSMGLKHYIIARNNPSFSCYVLVYGKKDNMPAHYIGSKVVSGDNHDLTFMNSTDTILGLKFKGSLKNSELGKISGLVGVYND